jgi:Cu2+-containing amine oxidase
MVRGMEKMVGVKRRQTYTADEEGYEVPGPFADELEGVKDCQGREEEDEDYCCNEGGIVVVEDKICVFERQFGLYLKKLKRKFVWYGE